MAVAAADEDALGGGDGEQAIVEGDGEEGAGFEGFDHEHGVDLMIGRICFADLPVRLWLGEGGEA